MCYFPFDELDAEAVGHTEEGGNESRLPESSGPSHTEEGGNESRLPESSGPSPADQPAVAELPPPPAAPVAPAEIPSGGPCSEQATSVDTSQSQAKARSLGPVPIVDRAKAGILVLRPVGGLCERLQAVVSGGLLAKDLGRVPALLWKPENSCNCAWERLFAPASWLQVLDQELEPEVEQDEQLQAALELLSLWDMACLAVGHEDLLDLALERLNRTHWSHFHNRLACLVDPFTEEWKARSRLAEQPEQSLPDALRLPCTCIRASGNFYPPSPLTDAEQDELESERALFLRALPLASAVAQRVQKSPPGTVSVDARLWEPPEPVVKLDSPAESAALEGTDPWLQPLEQAMDSFADGSREVFTTVPCRRLLCVARRTDVLRQRWAPRYGRLFNLLPVRALGYSVPLAMEDSLVGLATMARSARVLVRSDGPRADICSLLGTAVVEAVASGTDSSAASGSEGESGASTTAVRFFDPSRPSGPFFVAGSWDNWKSMVELLRATATSDLVYEVEIEVQGGTMVEFQLFRGQDWNQRFFPTEDGLIWGPSTRQGTNWRLEAPEGCDILHLVWDPRGERSLQCRFVSYDGEEWCDAKQKLQGANFFMAGSWDDWKEFTELCPGSAGGGPPYRAKIQVRRAPGVEEFQVFRGRDWRQRFHPSVWGGKICGPSRGEGMNWRVEVPAGCKWLKVTWDPRGHRSLRWRCISHQDRVLEEQSLKHLPPEKPRKPLPLRTTLPSRVGNVDVPERLGGWRLLSLLGRGYVGAVYRARPFCSEHGLDSGDEDEEVAVKFPSLPCEVNALRCLARVDGVPTIVDEGYGPGNNLFLAMPVLGPSLKALLRCCDHDGRGGRVSWAAARVLGVRLVEALGGVHGAGLVHCDVNPGNVLFRLQDAEPQLVDFGWARQIGSAHFEKTVGTCMYNSIRAGFGGQRTPADDLESVGWLLLQCVLGRLPWADRDEGVSAQQAEAWQKRSEGISVAKELFLGDQGIFGPEFQYCPKELGEYLRLCKATSPDPAAAIDHGELVRSLGGRVRQGALSDCWEPILSLQAGVKEPRGNRYLAARGLVCWRPADLPLEGGTEKVCSVPRDFLIRTTGAECGCDHGGQWVQVDPVWAPKLPPALLEPSWLLKAKVRLPKIPWEDDTHTNGPLLVPVGVASSEAGT